jgi:hypothetical protein
VAGATVTVADVDCNIAQQDRDIYEDATDFLRAAVDFRDGSSAVYAADSKSWHLGVHLGVRQA